MTQPQALQLLKMGYSGFVTGPPGTGKTHLLREYIQWLKDNGAHVAVTASTGIASTHISGGTLHAWSGMGIKKNFSRMDIDELTQKEHLHQRYNETEVLIIDEVSMLSGELLDALDQIAQAMRANSKPFGGIQVVLSGDLFQLPPIRKKQQSNSRNTQIDFGNEPESPYITSSRVWNSTDIAILYLEETYRHDDNEFLRLLDEIRAGEVSSEMHKKLQEHVVQGGSKKEKKQHADVKNRTRLYTHNVDVDMQNEKRLDELDGAQKNYEIKTTGKKQAIKNLLRGSRAMENLKLKKGAEVMFIKNDQQGNYVNGTRGRVVGFESGVDGSPIVETKDGKEIVAEPVSWRREVEGSMLAQITQIPLRLAWAITVHKSQGMTLDEAVIDLSKSFAPGQGYVALSRLRGFDGLTLLGLNDTALEVDSRILETDKDLKVRSTRTAAHLEKVSKGKVEKAHNAFIERVKK